MHDCFAAGSRWLLCRGMTDTLPVLLGGKRGTFLERQHSTCARQAQEQPLSLARRAEQHIPRSEASDTADAQCLES